MIEISENKCEGKEYTIKEGDTLYKISRTNNVPLDKLLEANSSINIYNLEVGDKICIPVINVESDINNYNNDDGDIKRNTNNESYIDMNRENNYVLENRNLESNNEDYNRMFVYIVKEGDTLDMLLDKYDVSIMDLMNANVQNRVMLKPGSIVIVPAINK